MSCHKNKSRFILSLEIKKKKKEREQINHTEEKIALPILHAGASHKISRLQNNTSHSTQKLIQFWHFLTYRMTGKWLPKCIITKDWD